MTHRSLLWLKCGRSLDACPALIAPSGQPSSSHPSGLIATCWRVVEGLDDLSFTLLDESHPFPVLLAGLPDLQHDLVLLKPAQGVRLLVIPRLLEMLADSDINLTSSTSSPPAPAGSTPTMSATPAKPNSTATTSMACW